MVMQVKQELPTERENSEVKPGMSQQAAGAETSLVACHPVAAWPHKQACVLSLPDLLNCFPLHSSTAGSSRA